MLFFMNQFHLDDDLFESETRATDVKSVWARKKWASAITAAKRESARRKSEQDKPPPRAEDVCKPPEWSKTKPGGEKDMLIKAEAMQTGKVRGVTTISNKLLRLLSCYQL